MLLQAIQTTSATATSLLPTLDASAVTVIGRHATVQNSDFSFIGGNAVASWGYTNETATDPGRNYPLTNYPQAGVLPPWLSV